MLQCPTLLESIEIRTPPQFLCALWTAFFVLFLFGCGDETADAEPMAPPDVEDFDCSQPLSEAHGIRVNRCPDGTRLGIQFEDGPALDGVGPALEFEGQLYPPTAWPEALWRATGDTVEGRFPAAGDLPEMVYRLRLNPGSVEFTVEILPGEAVGFDSVDALYAKGAGMGVRLGDGVPEDWRAFPGVPGAVEAPRSGVIRRDEQLIYGAGRAIHLGAAQPGLGLTFSLDGDADPSAVGLRATLRETTRVVAPNAFSVSMYLRVGTDPSLLQAEYAASLVGPERRQSAGWGWRSGPTFGDRADIVLLSTHAAALSDVGSSHPHLVIDGRWYEALGSWRTHDGFSGGFAELADVVSPARVGVRWPFLHAEPVSGIAEAHPDWMIEGECAERDCTLVNPTLPAVQDTLRGEANRLFDQGVSFVIVSGLDAVPSDRQREVVPSILPTFSQAALEAFPGVALGSGRTSMVAAPPLTGACATPTATDQCAGQDATLDALRRQAQGLAARWHHDAIAPLDPGPIHVDGLPLGVARQWATLGAVAGGWYLWGDDATNVEPSAREIFLAPLEVEAIQPARPTLTLAADPPSVWVGDQTLAVFNWTDATRTWRVPADVAESFGQMRDVYAPDLVLEMDAEAPLEIPPNDVRFFIRSNVTEAAMASPAHSR